MGILTICIVVIFISKYFPQIAKEKKIIPKVLSEKSMIGCLEKTIPTMSSMKEEYKEIAKEERDIHKEEDLLQGILKTQISSIQGMEKIEEKAKKAAEENQDKKEKVEEKKEEEVIQTGVTTQVITNNPIKESYNTEYGKVKIKNETDYQLTRRHVKTRYYNRK